MTSNEPHWYKECSEIANEMKIIEHLTTIDNKYILEKKVFVFIYVCAFVCVCKIWIKSKVRLFGLLFIVYLTCEYSTGHMTYPKRHWGNLYSRQYNVIGVQTVYIVTGKQLSRPFVEIYFMTAKSHKCISLYWVSCILFSAYCFRWNTFR